MERLLRKLETAKKLVPAPVLRPAAEPARYGVLYFGSTAAAMEEALTGLAAKGVHLDAMRVRAFPFAQEVAAFVRGHEQVFVVEQNRDGQLRTLLLRECGLDPTRLAAVLHYDGTPITARFIGEAILERLAALNILPLRKAVS
jgi:2-oxoglutarate/2-oxoacid ferredoxin oxidoreductase subunit alpha